MRSSRSKCSWTEACMRFPAPARTAAFVAVIFLMSAPTIADTSCDCDERPGGRIACEDTQAAFCKVVRGKVDGYCKTPPKGLADKDDVAAWVLSEATGEHVTVMQMRSDAYATALRNRRWKSGVTVVT